MINDVFIAKVLAITPHHLTLNVMCKYAHYIQDDSNYWSFLGAAWKAGGTYAEQDKWLTFFRSKRRNKHKIMKTSERREFAKLPKVVTAYRAYGNEEELDSTICWSLDKKFVEKYAENESRKVAEREFKKSDIFAFFNRRKESEILVWRD